MNNIIINALIAGVGVGLITGILGCFTIWKRMAYFGDSLSHSALLGIAIGLLIGINSDISIIIVAIFFAILLTFLQNKKILSTDVLLGILAHSGLAAGMVLMSFLGYKDFDLHEFLFGDILKVSLQGIILIYIGVIIIYTVIICNWNKLLILIINRDIAESQGVSYFLYQLILMSLMAISVSVSVKIVGILLISSLLIIPAATAKQLARSPQEMCLISIIVSTLSISLGIVLSYNFKMESGPVIVINALIYFILVAVVKQYFYKKDFYQDE